MRGMVKSKLASRVFKTERSFQKHVMARIQVQFGELAWVYAPPTLARRGIPDLIMNICGLFVAWELKLDTAARDPGRERLQEYNCQLIARAQGLAKARVTPASFERDLAILVAIVDDYLAEIGQKRSKHS